MKRHERNRDFSPRAAVIRLIRPSRRTVLPGPLPRQGDITSAANRAARRVAAPANVHPDRGADPIATIAQRLVAPEGGDWHAFVAERLSAWGAGYFDDGPAGRRSPWWGQAPYAAWRGEAELDRTPELLGVRGFCAIARTLPRDADALLLRVAHELRMPGEQFETYCLRLLDTVPDPLLAACVQARGAVRAVKDILAIRAAWEIVLLDAFGSRQPGVGRDLCRDLATSLARDADDARAARRRA